LDRWSRLKQWVTEHRESLKIRAQVAEDAARWIENNRSPDYLYAGGAPLEKANSVMESNFLNTEESDFVRASLSKVEKQLFYTSLLSGEQMLESSRRIRAGFPDVRLEVLRQVLRETRPSARCNAAWLISEETDTEVFDELIRLVTNDSDAEVRRAAASSLVKLNRRELFA